VGLLEMTRALDGPGAYSARKEDMLSNVTALAVFFDLRPERGKKNDYL